MGGQHAPFSPSAAHRWMACPASWRENLDRPGNSSRYSEEGTFAHAVAAEILSNGIVSKMALGWTGTRYGMDSGLIVDKAMLEAVEVYVSAVRGTASLMLEGENAPINIESRVYFSPDVWGTCDSSIVDHVNDREFDVHVNDLKYGYGYVDEDENEQLLLYGIAIANAVEETTGKKLRRLHLSITQPRAMGEPWRTATVTREEAMEFAQKVHAAVEAAKAPDARYEPGPHCQYCAARPSCSALRQRALTVAQNVFPDGDLEAAPVPYDPRTMEPAALVKVMHALPHFEAWAALVRQVATERARQEHLPGYKLVQKIGNRRWEADEATTARTLEKMHIEPYEKSLISPATAEAAMRTNGASAKLAKAAISQLCVRPVTGEALVPESDKRPALPRGASVFPELTGEPLSDLES